MRIKKTITAKEYVSPDDYFEFEINFEIENEILEKINLNEVIEYTFKKLLAKL